MGQGGRQLKGWQKHFLGASGFAEDATPFELRHFFSFNASELKEIRSRRNHEHRLGAALQLGFLKMTGRALDGNEAIPPRLLRHLRESLAIRGPDLTSLNVLYARRTTLFAHQQWAAELLGIRPLTDRRARVLITHLRKEAQTRSRISELVTTARSWLYENRILIPGERRLRDWSRTALADAEIAMFEEVAAAIPETTRRRWRKELCGLHTEHQSVLEWLQTPPKRRSPSTMDTVLEKIAVLRGLGVHKYELSELRLERRRGYARQLRGRRPARLRKLKDPQQTLEVVSFLNVTLLELTDVVLAQGDMQGAKVLRLARSKVKETQANQVQALLDKFTAIEGIVDEEELSADELRTRIRAVLPTGPHARSFAAAVRWQQSQDARGNRPLLKRLLALEVVGDKDSPLLAALDLLRSAYENKSPKLPVAHDSKLASTWKDVLASDDRRRAFRGFEAAVVERFRQDLRRGAIWIDHSLDHKKFDDMLIGPREWQEQRIRHYKHLKVSRSVERHLKPVEAGISAALAGLAEAIEDGQVSVDSKGIHLKALAPQDEPEGLRTARRHLFDEIGHVQFPELVVEMDSHLRFSWNLLGREPRSEGELLSIYGALIAHGTEVDIAGVAKMIPSTSKDRISQCMDLFEDEDAMARANTAVVDFLRNHPVAKSWGNGTLASADSMSLEASRQVWNARVDSRHRRYAIGMYTHVLDQWGVIYDQPLVLNKRQAGAAIEGMVRQSGAPEVSTLAVDTHGHTDFAMAISKLLGFDLCPRLRNLSHRKLHVPKGIDVPDVLAGVVLQDVSMDALKSGWDSLVRLAASIETGKISAVVALERYGSASRGDPIHKAGTALGRMYRTLFLCDYFTNDHFRRELLRVLNYGESTHALQRTIHFGGIPHNHGRYRDELVAISGSLTLLTNLTMAWVTHRMQKVIDQRGRVGRMLDEATLRHIGPVHFELINFRGLYDFPIEEFAGRIMPQSGSAAASTRK